MLGCEPEPTEDRLADIAAALVTLKREAVQHRASYGIEETWRNCQDAYHGIDDLNRDEFRGLTWIKPTTINAPITTSGATRGGSDKRSTAFVRLTSRYVDAGSAKIAEILVPGDDKAFSFEPTPVPDLIKGRDDLTQLLNAAGQPMERYLKPGEAAPQPAAQQAPQPMPGQSMSGQPMPGQPMPGQPVPGGAPPTVPLVTKDLVEEALTKARESAKKAERQIFDWMVECQAPRELRRLLDNGALFGVGVLKGPFPDYKRSIAVTKGPSESSSAIQIKETIIPSVKSVSPWNIFPDPACGEYIKDGDYVFEREFFSKRRLRKLKGLPGYLNDQIEKAIAAGPTTPSTSGLDPNDQLNKHQYELWYFTGTLSREDFTLLNQDAAKSLPKNQKDVFAVVTMVNDIVIKATMNPLDSGELPYHNFPWQTRTGYWAGIGVAEQVQIPQRIVNASTRALLNNAGISAGPQIVIDQMGITPANGEWVVTPNKIWYKANDGSTDDVRKSFTTFVIPNVGGPLMDVIQYGMRLAEETSSIPLITQGLSGVSTPQTLGATQLQNNNANQLLRKIGYAFDGHVTVRLVQMYYEYLLLDPSISDDLKGDFTINAHGSIAMVERSIQDQTIAQMTPLAENPIFGVNPKKWFAVLAKSKKLDPILFQYTKEEQDAIDQQPKPQPPAIEVANIKAKMQQVQIQADQQRIQAEHALERELAQLDGQVALEAEKMRNTTAQLRSKLDVDRDTIYVQSETQRTQAEYDGKMRELQLKKDLALMDYAAQHQMSLETVRAKLEDTAMRLRVQKELSAANHSVALSTANQDRQLARETARPVATITPPTEPAGRAPSGKAFEA